MATKEEKNQKIIETNNNLDQIVKLNIEKDLVRVKELGIKLSFSDCKDVFEEIMVTAKELNDGTIDKLPYAKINNLSNQTKTILDRLIAISNFDPTTQSPSRDDLINQVNDAYETYYTHIFDTLNFIRLQKIKPSEIEADIKEKLEVVSNASSEADEKLREINEILSKSKQAAGKTGVAEYSAYFNDEASDHETKSKKWFKGVIVMSIAVGLLGVALMFWIKKDLSTGEAIQYSIAKFIVLSSFFYGLVWTTKNYNAHRHNCIVNKHRANSLNSFETFVKSTEDPATKDAVLLQATQSIFSPQSSGYDGSDGEGDPSNKFIEILRHIDPKGK